ncbi:hypothetical protein [Bacillus sp. JCM 19041]|uniref:hypothetical protein n=1 Tax=Bacillus sp. JCM 19041 TaxID=1460637 RepID=UPI0006D033B5
MRRSVLVAGESKKAKAVAAMLKHDMGGSVDLIDSTDCNAHEVINQADTIILIVPAKKEPYQYIKKLLSRVVNLSTKKVLLISTEGTVAHHSIIQISIRAYTINLLASIHLPNEILCVKRNGELIKSRKLQKKLTTMNDHRALKDRQVVS